MKTPGQLAYERDLLKRPTYDGKRPRTPWEQISKVARESWERDPGTLSDAADWIIEQAAKRGRPTCDEFAAIVWQWSNRGGVSPAEAARVMRQAGYVPFQGFPLVRTPAKATTEAKRQAREMKAASQ